MEIATILTIRQQNMTFDEMHEDPAWIKSARSLGLVVNAWTVTDPAIMDSLLDQQIDFITTDVPEMLLRK